MIGMVSPKNGQHFLIDDRIAQREVDYADIGSHDVVLEVGPGTGVLTKHVARKADRVVAVEIDEMLVKQLRRTMPDNVDVIHADVLEVDFSSLPQFNKIVANLPFQISSPITFKLLEEGFSVAVLMYQKEFAERMVAQPGSKDYSRLTVHVYYKAKCEILETVPKGKFKPHPRVDTSLVRMIPRDSPPFKVKDEALFLGITKQLFAQRRKKIKNVLSKTQREKAASFPFLDKRVEKLHPSEIAELSNLIAR